MKTKGIFGLLGVIVFLTVLSTTVAAIPYNEGDIFVGSGNGGVTVYDSTGSFVQILNTESRSLIMTGMCFDDLGNLYTTNFNDGTMSKFDNNGLLLTYPWGGPFSYPQSCVVDHYGNIYTGEARETYALRKFDSNGILLGQWNPTSDSINFIDLHADQKTMYYTSKGSSIKRYDVSTSTQLADFATGLNGPCSALRILADEKVLVACRDEVYLLDRFGSVLQTYPKINYGEAGNFVHLALDPDGNSFWTAAVLPLFDSIASQGGNIYKIDIRTGNLLTSFYARYTVVMGGLAIFGEHTVASGAISGMKFNDFNKNSVKDKGEPGIPGWTITLEDGKGQLRKTITDKSGNYLFDRLPPNNKYVVKEVYNPNEWFQTSPPGGSHTVVITPRNLIVKDKNFGNYFLKK